MIVIMMIIVMMDHCDDGDNNYSDGVDVGKEGHDMDNYDNDELRIQIIIFGSTCFKNDDDNRLHDDLQDIKIVNGRRAVLKRRLVKRPPTARPEEVDQSLHHLLHHCILHDCILHQ